MLHDFIATEFATMQRLTVNFAPHHGFAAQFLDVPDITTALVVAQINLDCGTAEIRDGERVLARLEKQGRDPAPFWRVG